MAYLKTRITELIGIEHPVIQDGMGTARTVKLASAVSNAGGLGSVSMASLSDPEFGARALREDISRTAALTDKPFAVNIPVGIDKDLGVVLPVTEAMVSALIDSVKQDAELSRKLKVLITSAGFPGPIVDRVREAGLIHIHKTGSTKHAKKAVEAGVQAIIASGYEMGGHTHFNPVHTFVLAPNVIEAVDVPVIISGGGRDDRTLAAALAMGAEALAMGTRFIVTEENDWHDNYKKRIIDAGEHEDSIFTAVYGPARGLRGPGMDRLDAIIETGELEGEELLDWKNEVITRAQIEGDVTDGIVIAGQVASGIHEMVRVAEFVPEICRKAAERIERMQALHA